MNKLTISVIGVLIFVFIVFVVVAENSPNYKAYKECESNIKSILKDPETATVHADPDTWSVWKGTDITHSVAANVRASNSFGAFIKQTMTCYFDRDGKFSHIN